MKRNIHQVYDNVFKNTPGMDIKLIVGNRNRSDANEELYEKDQNEQLYTIY